jgi:SAM-dependent methyltransferase
MLVTATLTPEAAKRFYDWFGRRQDLQAFYEDPALETLLAHADCEHATAVFEFGCGTGRLAERLLARYLPQQSRYLGVDVSSTMVGLTRERLKPWGQRAQVRPADGRLVSWMWQRIYSVKPSLLGGCRPIHLDCVLPVIDWTIRHRMAVTEWCITSEVLVAQK